MEKPLPNFVYITTIKVIKMLKGIIQHFRPASVLIMDLNT